MYFGPVFILLVKLPPLWSLTLYSHDSAEEVELCCATPAACHSGRDPCPASTPQ